MAADKSVLVTGAAGYIGSLLVPSLLDEGYTVTAYDNMSRNAGVSPLLSVASHPRLKIIKGDVTDEAMMKTVMAEQDAIVHLAALNGFPACDLDPERATNVNYYSVKFIAENTKPKQKLIFISSGSSYGTVDVGIVEESAPKRPLSLYGKTKCNAEKEVLKVGGVVLRPATLYGVSPRMRFDLMVNFFCHLAQHKKCIDLFEGHFMRNFVHVRDVVRGFIFALNNYDVMKGEAFHVGDESGNVTKNDVVAMIKKFVPECKIVGRDEKDLEVRSYAFSFNKIKSLGYHTKYSLNEGMKEIFAVLPSISEDEAISWRNF